ncbi:hypothetical protein YC2023_077664 [Brassica napus]
MLRWLIGRRFQLCANLTAAYTVIATLKEEQEDTRARLRAMEEMFDVTASGNLESQRAWDSVRQSVHQEPSAEEQAGMERQTDDLSSV